MISPAAALLDPNLLGGALGDPRPWSTWLVILKAAWGERLTAEEAKVFAEIAGGRKPPERQVSELWIVAGRRGGKSRMAGALATYLAAFIGPTVKRARGERGLVFCLAPTRSQATSVAAYARGFLEASPILAPEMVAVRELGVELRGDLAIEVAASNFRSIRGRTLLGAILDEAAFLRSEESALPDVEAYRAIMPALATTAGMLIAISSPYRRVGLLADKHRQAFGRDDPDVLVIQAPTEVLNPTIDRGVIARSRLSDPEAAASEWDAGFRTDISTLLDDALIERAIDRERPLELPWRARHRYAAFGDASGGRHDAFTLCIGHREGETFVADLVRARRPPFDPQAVANEYAALCAEYGVDRIATDNYSGEWVSRAFQRAGMVHALAPMPKSQLYLEALPKFAQGLVRIPEHRDLVRELRLLERRTSRSGRDSVDHPGGATDDLANALAGAMAICGVAPRNPVAIRVRGLV